MATDLLEDVKDLLDNNWTAGNTGSRTPTVNLIFDVKRIDFALGASVDHILVYESDEVLEDNAAGGNSKNVFRVVTADVRTMFSRDQMVLVKNEIQRIVRANEVDPFGDAAYSIADVTGASDVSDKSVKLWRTVLKISFKNYNG